MTLAEQREEFYRIGSELVLIAQHSPLDWRRAKELRDDLAEALITEAAKQKRARYLAHRAERKAARGESETDHVG